MNIVRHHARIAPRVAGIVASIALLASCGGSDASGATDTANLEATTTTTTAAAAVDTTPAADTVAPTSAPSTYTIVAGDTLSGIAGRAGVSVDGIIAANGWTDGSGHLILPGDVIDLPAGASTVTAAPGTSTAPATDSASTASVCDGGVFSDEATILDGETLADIAERIGRTPEELQRSNQFGTNGRPVFGTDATIVVPCVDNWPANTTFFELIDPATCETEHYSLRGLYTVQPDEDAAAIAAHIGVSLDRLQTENLADLATIQPGDQIGVCLRFYE